MREGTAELGWFDVSTLKEPYRIEGKKTMGLELVEQLNWTVPDVIFYPTGGGTGLIGMWKAFAELEELGWIDGKRPRMVAVQAEGCAPIVRAFEQGKEFADSLVGQVGQIANVGLLVGIVAALLVSWRDVLGAIGSWIFIGVAMTTSPQVLNYWPELLA